MFFGHKDSKDGAIHHSGDDLTGGNSEDGDDEVISVDMTKLNPNAASIIATITSYSGQNLSEVRDAYCRLVNVSANGSETEIVKYTLTHDVNDTALIAAKFYNKDGEWIYKAVGQSTSGKTVNDLRSIAKTV